jgi:hypothetical protein
MQKGLHMLMSIILYCLLTHMSDLESYMDWKRFCSWFSCIQIFGFTASIVVCIICRKMQLNLNSYSVNYSWVSLTLIHYCIIKSSLSLTSSSCFLKFPFHTVYFIAIKNFQLVATFRNQVFLELS